MMLEMNQIDLSQTLKEALDRWRSYEEARHLSDSYELFNPSDHYEGEVVEVQTKSGSFSLNNVIDAYDRFSNLLMKDSNLESLWKFVGIRVNLIREGAYWFTPIEGFVKELFEIIKQIVLAQDLRFSSQASQSLFVSVVTGFLSKHDASILPACDKLPFLWMGESYENQWGVYYRNHSWILYFDTTPIDGVSAISL